MVSNGMLNFLPVKEMKIEFTMMYHYTTSLLPKLKRTIPSTFGGDDGGGSGNYSE